MSFNWSFADDPIGASGIVVRSPLSFREVYLVTLWLQLYAKHRLGMGSVEAALLARHDDTEAINHFPGVPLAFIARRLLAEVSPAVGYVCCQRHTCRSSLNRNLGVEFTQLRKVLAQRQRGAADSTRLPPSSANDAAVFASVCAVHVAVRLVDERVLPPQVRLCSGSSAADEELLCAAEHAVVLSGSPRCGAALVVHGYHQPLAVTCGVQRYSGLEAALLGRWCPQWDSVMFYKITSTDDCQAVCSAISAACTLPHHARWRRLHLGALAGGVAWSVLMSAVLRLETLGELVLEACADLRGAQSVLCSSLAKSTSLKRLSLRNNPALSTAMRDVGLAVAASLQITSLDVALCHLTNQDALQLFAGLAEGGKYAVSTATVVAGCAQSGGDTQPALHLDVSHNNLSSAMLHSLTTQVLTAAQGHERLSQLLRCLVSLDVSGNSGLSGSSPTSPVFVDGALQSPLGVVSKFVADACPKLVRLRLNDTSIASAPSPTTTDTMAASSSAKKARNEKEAAKEVTNVVKRLLKSLFSHMSSFPCEPRGDQQDDMRTCSHAARYASRCEQLAVPWYGTTSSVGEDGAHTIVPVDVDVGLGGCQLNAQAIKAAFVAVQSLRQQQGDKTAPPLRVRLTLYASPCVAQVLSDVTTPLSGLVVLDLRSCSLGLAGTVDLCAALERSAPLLLESLLLCDNQIEGASCAPSSKGRSGLQSIAKAMRGAVAPHLESLHISYNAFSSFRPLHVLFEQCAPTFRELNLSGHPALRGRPAADTADGGTIGRPPLVDLVACVRTAHLSGTKGAAGVVVLARNSDCDDIAQSLCGVALVVKAT